MIKKMKLTRVLMAILLVSTMMLGLVACSGGDDKSDEKETTTKASNEKNDEKDTQKATEKETEGEKALNTDGVLNLALNVMWNDADSAYYGNEYGASIEVKEDGQYTLVFDCATDLSTTASQAGVMGIEKLTSVYIKDHAVTMGQLSASNITSCDIKYDKIVVDGKELTITKTEPKSGIKSSGIFDTNDPINSWDGSAVSEVVWDEANHVVSIDGVTKPQKIEVTFTLSNLVFAE